jgi:hypothetical protein
MASVPVAELAAMASWLLAGIVALYFSIGSARVWTSISTGFLLVFVSEGYRLFPWVREPRLAAIHLIVGTIAILVITYGFQEYYVFSRTMDTGGRKTPVYVLTLAVVAASMGFLLANPEPTDAVLRNIAMVGNVNWAFLTLINLDIVSRIRKQVAGTPMAAGFTAFLGVLVLMFLWRGSDLYLQVYGWDGGVGPDMWRVWFSHQVHAFAGVASGLSAGATFLFLLRLLR